MLPRPVLRKLPKAMAHIWIEIKAGRINTYGKPSIFLVIHSKMHIRREKDLPLLPPAVNACLQIPVGHLSKITALTSCHKRQSSYSEPSINVQFSDKSRISISTGRSQSAEEQRRVGNSGSVVLWISIPVHSIGTRQQPSARCENTINQWVEMWQWRYLAAQKGVTSGLFKIKVAVFNGTFWCLMPQ